MAKLANAEQMNAKKLEKYLQKMIKDNLPPEIQNEMKNLPIKDLPFKFP